MNVQQYFSTPFLHTNIDDLHFCAEIEKFILTSMNEKNEVKDAPQSAHPDLFESEFNFLNWNVPQTNQLKKILLNYLFEFIQEVNHFTQAELQKIRFIHESWFHVAKSGGYFQNHTHPNHSWSMVLCVNPGSNQEENEFEQGKLVFWDPRGNASMFLDEANGRMKRPYAFSGFKIKPGKGSLLIFPSYLQHAVEPYRGDDYRITVAANFRFNIDE